MPLFLSFVDNEIWIMSFNLEFLELVRNLQWLLEIRTYTNKNRNHINASSHISLELLS